MKLGDYDEKVTVYLLFLCTFVE